MSSQELTEWLAFYSIDPFGEERADARQAITSCIIANSNRGKSTKPFKVDEFFPVREPKKQSMSEMKNILKNLASR